MTWHSGSPKRVLNSISLRTVFADHQAGEQHALEGQPSAFIAATVGSMISAMTRAEHFGRHDRGRGIGAHAAGVGTLVAVADALVILRRGEGERLVAVAKREERGLLAVEKVLDHHFRARRAEGAAEQAFDRRFRFGQASWRR